MADSPGDAPDDGRAGAVGSPGGQRRSRRHLPILIGLTVVTLALVGVGLFFGMRTLDHNADQARREQAVGTAGDVAVKLTTLDHRDADQQLRALRAMATPQFAEQFGILSHAFADTVRETQIVSSGRVTSAGVQRADDESARVLVAVRATVRDAAAPQGEPRNYRLGVDLVRQDDKWLVSNVEFIL